MVGSVDAPEPGFRPGALGSWHASGVPACAGGSGMRWRALARWGAWHALGAWCALAGSGACWGSGARRGFGVPWRLTRSRLRLGWCCGLRVAPGFLFAGLLAVANAMFYFALTWLEYTGCEHMRA